VLLVLIWSLLHHLVAGIRYLILDLHIGLDLGSARASALAVYAVSLPLTLIAALFLFGVI
jgi:succinate dehydrogenase / fumarate reductase, cytochrome b subunit